VSEGLKTCDLLINYNNSKSPLRVPLYGIGKESGTTVSATYRVNSGSSVATTINGKTWSADNQYAFDNLEPYSNPNLTSILCTDDDVLFLTEQSSNGDKKPFRYEFPLANGDYGVRLHFAEIYWGAPGSGLAGGAGSRVMSISLENQLRLANFDVSAEAGRSGTAIVKNFAVTVADQKLNIDFSATVNRPMVCAVEVYKFTKAAPLTVKSVTSDSTVRETAVNSTNLNAKIDQAKLKSFMLYPNPAHNNFSIAITADNNQNYDLTLIDVLGRKHRISNTMQSMSGSAIQVDISKLRLNKGIYFLNIQSRDSKTTNISKIIIE
ncbi:MAG: malectin domain-containing carbohydrate-binding protein, partial [Ginsengibacter sp.]